MIDLKTLDKKTLSVRRDKIWAIRETGTKACEIQVGEHKYEVSMSKRDIEALMEKEELADEFGM